MIINEPGKQNDAAEFVFEADDRDMRRQLAEIIVNRVEESHLAYADGEFSMPEAVEMEVWKMLAEATGSLEMASTLERQDRRIIS